MCQRGKGTEPKGDGLVLERMEWMEKMRDVMVVELEPLEAVWKWEEVVSRRVVMMVVVEVYRVMELPFTKFTKSSFAKLLFFTHVTDRRGKCFSDLLTHLLQECARVGRRRIFGSGRLSIDGAAGVGCGVGAPEVAGDCADGG